MIGNVDGKVHRLGNVVIAAESPYAHIYVTALDPGETIIDGDRLLVTALGPGGAGGDGFGRPGLCAGRDASSRASSPLATGAGSGQDPDRKDGPAIVTPLDQNGRKVDSLKPLEVSEREKGFSFEIDTAETKSVYFLVEF